MTKMFPVIDPIATGANIVRLRKMRGLTVRDVQNWFGFDEPQAIYKWQKGKSLPSIENLLILSVWWGISINEILVTTAPPQLNIVRTEQQEASCCSSFFSVVLAHCTTASLFCHSTVS